MPAYVDTSALVKRYIAEVGSPWVRQLLAQPAQYVIYTAALAKAEVISALQRRVRDGHLAVAQAQGLPPPSFVVADIALRAAATAEGFVVEDPLQHP